MKRKVEDSFCDYKAQSTGIRLSYPRKITYSSSQLNQENTFGQHKGYFMNKTNNTANQICFSPTGAFNNVNKSSFHSVFSF